MLLRVNIVPAALVRDSASIVARTRAGVAVVTDPMGPFLYEAPCSCPEGAPCVGSLDDGQVLGGHPSFGVRGRIVATGVTSCEGRGLSAEAALSVPTDGDQPYRLVWVDGRPVAVPAGGRPRGPAPSTQQSRKGTS